MRSAVLAPLLGGCLIVNTYDEPIDDPCPTVTPALITEGIGPIALVDDTIYFARTPTMLARVPASGGEVTDLASFPGDPQMLAANATTVYWATGTNDVLRVPVTGGTPYEVANTLPSFFALIADDTGAIYGANGLWRIRASDDLMEHLGDGDIIVSIAAHDHTYFYVDLSANQVRRATPTVDLAHVDLPGPIAADDKAVYYVDEIDPFNDHDVKLLAIAPDGGAPVTTASELHYISEILLDATNVYLLATSSGGFRIQRVSRFGGSVETLACPSPSPPVYLAHDATYLYWSDGHALYRLPK